MFSEIMNIKFFFLFSIATYGARVRGNVFRIIFLILDKEFESVETSSGFASLQGFFFWVSAMHTYSRIFAWNHNFHLLDFCHLTIFFGNHESIFDFAKEDWKQTKNLQTYCVPYLDQRLPQHECLSMQHRSKISKN